MKELNNLITHLRNTLADKETEIAYKESSADSNIYSQLDNRRSEIDFFEQSAKLVDVSVIEKAAVIANFENDARRIEVAIKKIGN